MRPSELVSEFGNPVAYYPGLVKHLGSVNAVLMFCQIFYWTGKEVSDLGIYKSVEDIGRETGMTYREQVTARKQLVQRGVLIETNKKLEHRIYFKINTDRLDQIVDGNSCNSPTAESAFGEMTKAQSGSKQKRSSEGAKSAVRGMRKAQFDPTENTTKITTEITTEITDLRKSKKMTSPEKQYGNELETQTACKNVWKAYCGAYYSRYGVSPVRNQKINAQVKQFIQRVGVNCAPDIAHFYLTLNDAFLVRKLHPVGSLLADAESLYTQWATGNTMTATRARQIDQSQANYSAADEGIAMLRAKREREAQDANRE